MPNWPWDKSNDPSPETPPDRVRELEAAILKVKSDLENRVRERTRELTAANEALRAQILERKRAEGELRQLNSYLDSIIENIPDMIFLKDAKDLRFVRFNRAGEELLGFSRADLLGKNDTIFSPRRRRIFLSKKTGRRSRAAS